MTDTPVPRPPRRARRCCVRGRFVRPGTAAPDLHSIGLVGGRRSRTPSTGTAGADKVVTSTHVNCTGSCRWNGCSSSDGIIITWETQADGLSSVGPDRPEYEPRGLPRGAAFSWYTYSPTRVRYPYVRGVLLEMYREAKARLSDPVLAWADIQGDPERRRRYQRARGKGGLVRASWDEAVEMVAAAHVHHPHAGPGPYRGLLPIPAMSMVSHAAGAPSTPSSAPRCCRSTTGTPTCPWRPRRSSATRRTCRVG
ncbi:molybdopterin-dependent oxidoreductase [Streptomyces thinghirensis]|nr:molybdopterin-dependent oxidoreductase [Streptomyces thinghirensis]